MLAPFIRLRMSLSDKRVRHYFETGGLLLDLRAKKFNVTALSEILVLNTFKVLRTRIF